MQGPCPAQQRCIFWLRHVSIQEGFRVQHLTRTEHSSLSRTELPGRVKGLQVMRDSWEWPRRGWDSPAWEGKAVGFSGRQQGFKSHTLLGRQGDHQTALQIPHP